MFNAEECRQKDHQRRLKTIAKRKPGTSKTLDNTPPVVSTVATYNPRKLSLMKLKLHLTEQENKSMLQRISRILTAAPSVNDDDYIKMKKLVDTRGRQKTDDVAVEQKNVKFFARLKEVPGVYNVKKWEEDYAHQLYNQIKFMRKVKVKQSRGEASSLLSPTSSALSPGGGSYSSDESVTEDELQMMLEEAMYADGFEAEGTGEARGGQSSGGDGAYDDDAFDAEEDGGENEYSDAFEPDESSSGHDEAASGRKQRTDTSKSKAQVRSKGGAGGGGGTGGTGGGSGVSSLTGTLGERERSDSTVTQPSDWSPLKAFATPSKGKGGSGARGAGAGPESSSKLPPISSSKKTAAATSDAKRAKRTPHAVASGGVTDAAAAGGKRSAAQKGDVWGGFDKAGKSGQRLKKSGKKGSSLVPIVSWDDDDDDDDDDEYDEDEDDADEGADMYKWDGLDRTGKTDGSSVGSAGRGGAGQRSSSSPHVDGRRMHEHKDHDKHRASIIPYTPLMPGAGANAPSASQLSLKKEGSISLKRNSSHLRAELTHMDRDIRIYTVEMDSDALHGGADDPSSFNSPSKSSSDAFSPEKVFSHTSALSPGAIPGVSTYSLTPRESECRSFYTARAEIKCWLLMEMKTLLIRVYVPDAFPLIDVQSQISLRDLASNKGMTVDNLMTDFKTLELIATEIISEVELTIEDETAAAALAAKQRKEKGISRRHKLHSPDTPGGGGSGDDSSGGEGVGSMNSKGKPTRRTRLVVHLARKGRRRHRSTAEAFLDEQFMSHLAPTANGKGSEVWAVDALADAIGAGDAQGTPSLRQRLRVPEPVRLEVTRSVMVSVTVTVPGPKAVAAARNVGRRPSAGAPLVSTPSVAVLDTSTTALHAAATVTSQSAAAAEGPELSRLPSPRADAAAPGAPVETSAVDGVVALPAALVEKMLLKDKDIAPAAAPAAVPVATTLAAAPSPSLLPSSSGARSKNLPVVKQLPKKQKVSANVQVSTTKPGSSAAVVDKVALLVTFTAATKDNFNDKVAVRAGDVVRLTVGLPSIMQADDELILEFFENLVDGLYVVHDSNAGTNTASIAIGGRVS